MKLKLTSGRPLWLAPMLLMMMSQGLAQNSSVAGVISFEELPGKLIGIRGELDKQPNQLFIFDTGNSIPLLVDSSAAKRLNLKTRMSLGRTEITGLSDQKTSTSTWVMGVARQGKARLAEGWHPTADLGNLSAALGVNLSGVLGRQLASRYALEINYDVHEIRFRKPDQVVPLAGSVGLQLLNISETGPLIIEGWLYSSDCVKMPVRFLLDTGLDQEIILGPGIAAKLPPEKTASDEVVGASVGSLFEFKQSQIYGIELGGFRFRIKNVLALDKTSSTVIGKVADAAIGAPLLRRFNIAIIRSQSKVYFSPRSLNDKDLDWTIREVDQCRLSK